MEINSIQRDAMSFAKYIIDKCTHDNVPISNLQLQKILYFIQINFIRKFHREAFCDDFLAWQYGPVVQKVYDEFSCYGEAKIMRTYPDINIFDDIDEKDTTDNVILLARRIEPWELVRKSHKTDGPWDKVYCGYSQVIPKNLIIDYAENINGKEVVERPANA